MIAIVATFINLYLTKQRKDSRLAMAMGLSFTAMTLCAGYGLLSAWVISEDWTSLREVVPTMERMLWILTIISILLNVIPIFFQMKNKREA